MKFALYGNGNTPKVCALRRSKYFESLVSLATQQLESFGSMSPEIDNLGSMTSKTLKQFGLYGTKIFENSVSMVPKYLNILTQSE